MDQSIQASPKRKTTADYKAALAQLLAEMNLLDEQMDRDCAEIERLKAETQVIKARTSATLARLQEHVNSLSKAV